ncbi:MAG TPA: glycosyl hydrolase [Patescibacteria group bacterium]|nr:glycosyl hydrolase [Patescibacteria group bacterium]
MKRNIPYFVIVCISVFLGILFFSPKQVVRSEGQSPAIWPVRSVDTMKTSRDMARVKLNDPSYDTSIQKELTRIKELGANYVTIDTPYDDEFYPYLLRWVTLARKTGLHVWFRGNFSGWEGWFDYPKNIDPQEHQRRTAEFIATHSELFQDGDAFDPCPECENAGFWKQPEGNTAFNEFIMNQQVVLKNSFDQIHKNVHINWTSIIGGRAKEVLDTQAVRALGNLITIDHYVKTPKDMETYINYFSQSMKSDVLIGEFGAPIPDINGPMTEDQQANFVDSIFNVLYAKKQYVEGVNYFALSNGTTEIIDALGNVTKAYNVIKKYYIPGQITGDVTNTLGDFVSNEPVKTIDGTNQTVTDAKGKFSLVGPAVPTTIVVGGKIYQSLQYAFDLTNGDTIHSNIQLSPIKPNRIYIIRLWLRSFINTLKQRFTS